MVTVRFEKSGYVKDDDAKDWNADDLLKSLKEGTEASNDERRQRRYAIRLWCRGNRAGQCGLVARAGRGDKQSGNHAITGGA